MCRVAGRGVLVARAAKFAVQFDLNPLRPPHLGGYIVIPEVIEFWQGRPSRLHDRITYSRLPDGTWRRSSRAPLKTQRDGRNVGWNSWLGAGMLK